MTTPALAACAGGPDRQNSGQTSTSATSEPTSTPRGRILLAYFSRPGENYYYGDRTYLETGNTEVVARKIHDLIGCDLYRIDPADPYPGDYDATVKRNVREQDTDARPAIKGRLPRLEGYGTILLASPIWNVRAPMIMTTLADGLDFRDKTVHPVTTYAMSGLGTTERDYAAVCRGATMGAGLAVQGEQANDAGPTIKAWLQRTGLLQG
ncbi:flavodoxin [Streptomyces sp. NPDC002855]|uniref:flavodoxin n=1 Tax=Streptomyces sp. NPDC002855 TaxID=3154437 RepID=UPI003317D2D5